MASPLAPLGLPLRLAAAWLVALAWLLFELAARRWGASKRSGGVGRGGFDHGSFLGILVAVWASLAADFALYEKRLGGLLPWEVVPVGVAVALAGIGFRSWAVATLGRYFSPVIRLESDHRIVREGPYRWLRHPSYTGGFLVPVGIALTLGTVAGTLLTIALTLAAYLYRIHVEERMLRSRFGEEYARYAKETWRLFPWVY